jgi:hypothetical protein
MEMKKVKSSNVDSVGYNDGQLDIKFKSGSIYRYFDVPKDVYEALMRSKSIGKYVSASIVKKFKHELLSKLEDKSKRMIVKFPNEASLQSAVVNGKALKGDKIMYLDSDGTWVACVVTDNGGLVRYGKFWLDTYAIMFLNNIGKE